MSMFNKTAFDIIAEAAESDSFNTSSIFDSDVDTEIGTLFDSIDAEIDASSVIYPAESIPVLKVEEHDGCDCPYCVEFDMLAKYMTTNGVDDIDKAMMDIAKCNDIECDELALLIPSREETTEYIEEAKKIKKATGSKKKLDSAYNTATLLKTLKGEVSGIKITKKKSKKKDSKKK